MTYDEAVIYKLSRPRTFIEGDIEFTTYVTPLQNADFSQYCDSFRINRTVGDDFAIPYSSDKQFSVYGICYYRDINYLYFKFLQ